LLWLTKKEVPAKKRRNPRRKRDKMSKYTPHVIEPWVALKKDHEGYEYSRYNRDEDGYIKDPFHQGHTVASKQYELDKILEQLKNYPTPVSDCDEQFNHLLKERDRLRKEILLL